MLPKANSVHYKMAAVIVLFSPNKFLHKRNFSDKSGPCCLRASSEMWQGGNMFSPHQLILLYNCHTTASQSHTLQCRSSAAPWNCISSIQWQQYPPKATCYLGFATDMMLCLCMGAVVRGCMLGVWQAVGGGDIKFQLDQLVLPPTDLRCERALKD